jgi:hypothetical protein
MASPDIRQGTGPGHLRGTVDTTAWPLNRCQAQVEEVRITTQRVTTHVPQRVTLRREWATVEPDARRDWEQRHKGTWEEFKEAIRHAWDQVRGRR